MLGGAGEPRLLGEHVRIAHGEWRFGNVVEVERGLPEGFEPGRCDEPRAAIDDGRRRPEPHDEVAQLVERIEW
ncbi:hypothetical protein F8O01_01535 [Pseudoclavibacter chungangensis]|uniref:Uncharacterized protein n=1 Tax=Pseudoclavibacter chungangensis TaxID=587635 RepID=A0A7J5C0M8_9MICO|nr:hypothetical protein [Pseudoclavibacter chungangensis]KAB1662176.1 hypothetical protein F8O01_01535 [Pseudoclavibacter chungangensis]NYJ65365.1 hypothetical protein [Pseudoclavibacter chungangensis]